MKKKFLVTLFAAIMLCLFAFSASAANEVTLVTGEKADLRTVFYVNSKNEVVKFNDGYTKNDVTDVIFPDDIVGLEANGLFSSSTTIKTLTFEATDEFFISGDAIFTKCSVEKITFNPDCIVEIRKGNFSSCTSLIEITFPKFRVLTGSAFGYCSKMQATNELVFVEGMTEIGGHAFHDCSSLTGVVVFPSTLEKIQEYSFQNTGFTGFDFSKCAKLTLVGGSYGGPFNDNDSITRLDMSGCTSLTTIEKGSLAQGCANLEEVILPPNLENIPHKAFAQCPKLSSIVLPASMTYIADESFHTAMGNKSGATFTMYIQSKVKFSSYYVFRDSGNVKIEFVLLGDSVTAEELIAVNTGVDIIYNNGGTNPTFTADTPVFDYLDPKSPWTYTVGGTLSSHVIVENYCKSLATTGDHSETDEHCNTTDYCEDCEYLTCEAHTNTVTMMYSDYTANGQKITSCVPENCNGKGTEALAPIFRTLGYSIPRTGCAITTDYEMNISAFDNYKTYLIENGKTIEIGIFIGNSETFGGTFIKADGTVDNSYAFSQKVKADGFLKIKCTVADFTTDEATLTLVMGLYVIEDGKVSYIQHKGQDAYAGTVTKGETTLDVVTITKIAELTGIELALPTPKAISNKED